MGKLKKLACVVAAGCSALAVSSMPNANAATNKVVPDSSPNWVGQARYLGHVKASTPVSFRVLLAPQGGVEGLKAAVANVSNPHSRSYRHFLSASQFHARYDASADTVKQVSAWLAGRQLSVTGVEAHHRYISVTGSVAKTEAAFGSRINRYQHAGQTVQANATVLKVPPTLAPFVSAVSGLDTTTHKMKHQTAPPPPGFANARPCSLSYGQVLAKRQADFKTPLPKFKNKVLPYSVCGYTGPQFRAAYEGDTNLTGSGVTVAITDAYAAPTIAADANRYAVSHGDGAYARGQLTQVLPKSFRKEADCGPSGWFGEETLDVEAVHAMATNAKIRYYASSSCFDQDFLKTLAKVVDENKAQLVTNSWSDVEQNETSDQIVSYQRIFLQGAMQGISFLFSSGDSGDEVARTGLKQVDYPASDPYVTAVGGTADAIGADGSFAFQTGWGTQKYTLTNKGTGWTSLGFLYGAGGGSSSLFNQPVYERGVVPAGQGAGRAVPDVGLDADPNTGMLIGETQTFPDGVRYGEFRLGGTSLASPLFAGMTALLLQHSGGPLGLLNPVIYAQAKGKQGTFTDIKGAPKDPGVVRADFVNGVNSDGGVIYSVRTFNQDSSLSTAKGWDPVTGVGSPNSTWLTSVSRS